MLKNFSKKNLIIIFFFAFFYSLIVKIFNVTNIFDNIKYVLFSIHIFLCFVYIKNNKIEVRLIKEYVYMLLLIIILLLISFINSLLNNSMLSFRTIIELVYILLPVTSAICIINIYSIKEIITFMKIILIISLIAYFVEISTFNISFSDILKINFIESYSPFESYIFADISICCFCFFSYFKTIFNKKITEDIFANPYYYLSFFFVIMTFKRILILFAVFLYIFNIFRIGKIRISNKIVFLIIAFFIISTISYTWLLHEENSKLLMNLFSINLDTFSVGRKWYFSLVEANSNLINGYGSTTNILTNILGPGKYLEMDLVKIYIETGPIALGFFIWAYWKQIYNNLFSIIICFFLFINMLFSHSLTTFYAWILFFLLFYTIKIDNENEIGDKNDFNNCTSIQ